MEEKTQTKCKYFMITFKVKTQGKAQAKERA